MVDVLIEVRCRGCRRLLGYGPADFRIYCDSSCADDFPAVVSEDRDALIEAINQETGLISARLGEQFGIARQRVDQILARRDLTYEIKAEQRRLAAEARRIERERIERERMKQEPEAS